MTRPFRLGEEEHAPNRVRFEDVVNGKALRATVSGTEYRRIETCSSPVVVTQ